MKLAGLLHVTILASPSIDATFVMAIKTAYGLTYWLLLPGVAVSMQLQSAVLLAAAAVRCTSVAKQVGKVTCS